MTGRRHTPDLDLLEQVLGRKAEKVQVWALDRKTGEPVYLPEGHADAMRETTRERLRCPYPGCDAVISTRGKSKRDHFWHPDGTPHPTGGESENHFAAKAMIATWAARRLPHGASVREEHSVKDPVTSVNRRADVMVTWPLGTGMTAFEVEYKQFAVEDWRRKQGDYDIKSIGCVWLIGHTRLRRAHWILTNEDAHMVKVPHLATGWVPGGHVLIVDPATRTIGTLAGDRDITRRVEYPDWDAWVALDSIDDCTLDVQRGLITPAMRRIEEHEAEEETRRQREETRRRAAEERQAAERARRQADEDLRQANWERIDAANHQAWDRSPHKAAVIARWEDRIPKLLEAPCRDTWGIHALPVHWHAVLYGTHIHPASPGDQFTISHCYQTLDREGIKRNWDKAKSFRALIAWLETVSGAGLVTIHHDHKRRVHHLTVNANLDTILAVRAARQARRAEADRLFAAERERKAEEKAERDAKEAAVAAIRAKALLDAQRASDAVDQHSREAAWNLSGLRAQVLAAHGGTIPQWIAWTDDPVRRTNIHAEPAHWHAAIYMTLIHGRPAGTPIEIADARQTLDTHQIPHADDCTAAVEGYLYNLKQRGILASTGDEIRLDGMPTGYQIPS